MKLNILPGHSLKIQMLPIIIHISEKGFIFRSEKNSQVQATFSPPAAFTYTEAQLKEKNENEKAAKKTLAYTDEIQLSEQCAAGNAFAQKLLYDQYAAPMMLVCCRYIAQREDAQEVLMDAFYNCYKNISGFTYIAEGSLKAWIKKIVVNQCLMHLRKKKLVFVDSSGLEDMLPVQDGILDHLTAKEIMKLVQGLPAGYRTVFNLYLFEGKTHREISELLGITENTSKSQLHKAKAMLQMQIMNQQKTKSHG